jgi:hypothetical protein
MFCVALRLRRYCSTHLYNALMRLLRLPCSCHVLLSPSIPLFTPAAPRWRLWRTPSAALTRLLTATWRRRRCRTCCAPPTRPAGVDRHRLAVSMRHACGSSTLWCSRWLCRELPLLPVDVLVTPANGVLRYVAAAVHLMTGRPRRRAAGSLRSWILTAELEFRQLLTRAVWLLLHPLQDHQGAERQAVCAA